LLGEPQSATALTDNLPAQTHEGARAHETIYHRGEAVEGLHILCVGWAYRYIQLADGRRQILSFLLPGDVFSPTSAFENEPHFSVKALTDVRFSRFDRKDVKQLLLSNRNALDALCDLFVKDTKDGDELILDLGRRNAEERIAHLMLSLCERIEAREVIRDNRYPLPLRQQHIADIAGLTPVHVGRVIGAFRKDNIIDLSQGYLTILNRSRLERIGGLR
jgi:CRP-like cAMP-binding protein